MNKFFQVCAAASLTSVLVACGGGGGDGGAPAGPLTALAGTWVGDCRPTGVGVRDKIIISVNSDGTEIDIKNEIDYFDAQDCSGPIGVTLSYLRASVKGTAKGIVDVNMPAPSSEIVKASTAEMTVLPGQVTMSTNTLGWERDVDSLKGVTTIRWCILGVDNNPRYCFNEDAVALDSDLKTSAFYINGTTLYTYQDDDGNGQFESSGTFQRLP